jgi:hypothetical protein
MKIALISLNETVQYFPASKIPKRKRRNKEKQSKCETLVGSRLKKSMRCTRLAAFAALAAAAAAAASGKCGKGPRGIRYGGCNSKEKIETLTFGKSDALRIHINESE